MSAAFLLRSPAKLNWTLEVLGRREDGFHSLRSWFVAVGLYDSLQVRVRDLEDSRQARLRVHGPESGGVPEDGSNLVLKTEDAWRAAGGDAPLLAWTLHKSIPAGAGLGGGSGNAAAAIRLLECIGKPSAIPDLRDFALQLGSDVPFFLESSGAMCLAGRGEVVLDAQAAPPGWVVLAVPPFAVSTAKVFDALKARSCDGAPVTAFPLPPTPGRNDLLAAAEAAYPELADFHSSLDAGADFHLSGSGGTFFAWFPDRESAQACADATRSACERIFVVPLQKGAILRDAEAVTAGGEA